MPTAGSMPPIGKSAKSGERRAAAQITFQSYFKLYQKLAGMSGTAAQNRRKVWRFTLPVSVPPLP